MVELSSSSEVGSGWRTKLREAQAEPLAVIRLAREANSRGEHMLALAVAQKALRGLSLASAPEQAVPLRQQMALALARSGATEEAMEVLRDSLVAAPEDGETLGLLGRLHKDLAEQATEVELAARHRQRALGFYAKGFAIERSAYCGINTAVLEALTGDPARARKTARRVLELPPDEDRLWSAATIAMARMLCGEQESAGEAFARADRAGEMRRSDLAAVRREARRLASVLHGDSAVYDACFRPAAVAVFAGGGDALGAAECLGLARWLEENNVVCAWSAAASGEEAAFLECAAALGVETCAVLPEREPRAICRKAVARSGLVDYAGETGSGGPAAAELARHIATARAVARAASWDVPLLPVTVGSTMPACWVNLSRAPFALRAWPQNGSRAPEVAGLLTAVLCVRAVADGDGETAGGLPEVWENHPARYGCSNGSDGPYLFSWSTVGEAGRAAVDLRERLQGGRAKAPCSYILHATAKAEAGTDLDGWARRVYPGRIHATGRFADLATLDRGRNFDLCYVGTIDCEAEPLGMRLYHLRGCGSVEVFMERSES